jgi:hypothetical protein
MLLPRISGTILFQGKAGLFWDERSSCTNPIMLEKENKERDDDNK